MAEVVELRVERGINELLQLERADLFASDEVRKVIKKRKMFEYRLQKFKKSKEDFLRYICYEESLLRLVAVRRKKTGYSHKTKEIDQSIASRISALYRAVVFRNQADVQLWLSYIEFCRKMNWKGNMGSLFTRMLQVHNRKDHLWVAAAKFEFEENNSANSARRLLQRGLQFLKESPLLWQEYFRFELMYADKIRKRQEVVKISGRSSPQHTEEEEQISDNILSGKIALVVYDNAVQTVPDPMIASRFLEILSDFDEDWRKPLMQHILSDMQSRLTPGSERREDGQSLTCLKDVS